MQPTTLRNSNVDNWAKTLNIDTTLDARVLDVSLIALWGVS